MYFLGSRRKTAVYFCVLAGMVVFLNVSFSSRLRVSFDSIFSGLLALTGFVFTARTFITFKLNEIVYGSANYRAYVKKLKEDGAYNNELYDPLREVDRILGNTTEMCLTGLGVIAIAAILPDIDKINISCNINVDSFYKLISLKTNVLCAIKNPRCFLNLVVVLVTDAAILYFVFILLQTYKATKCINSNIKDIIDHWEEDYNNPEKGEK